MTIGAHGEGAHRRLGRGRGLTEGELGLREDQQRAAQARVLSPELVLEDLEGLASSPASGSVPR
ncbi:MAG: hypothetical protein KC486_33845 [Myxococcales bacterium]|nr:hypothetical protein [Myxococcales bacterium]